VPDGVTIQSISVFQDELVGRKLDATIDLAASSVRLRAERLGIGDGRVYHIFFTVDDGLGDDRTCTLKVGVVPHDQSGDLDAIDGGPLYDSTIPGNIPPRAVDDQNTTDEDTPLVVAATDGVLGNDEDWDEDPLTVAAVNGEASNVGVQITLLSGALLTLNADGSYLYDPDGQFEYLAVGETFTDTFTYQASDTTDVSTATVSIGISGVNDAPTADDDSGEDYTTDEDAPFTTGNVLTNDSDPDTSDALFVESLDTTGTVGQVTDNGDGTFDYDPNDQFEYLATGETVTDTFTYTASDGNGGNDTATMSITITGLDDTPPQAVEDQNTTDEDTVLSVDAASGVLGNDLDPDGDDTLTVIAVNGDGEAVGNTITLLSGAQLTLNADGSYDYDPNSQFDYLAFGESVTDTFSYTVSDDQDGTDTAKVTITVAGVNDAPMANDDGGEGYTTGEDITFTTANVLDNDSDPDTSDTLTIVSIDTNGTIGTVIDNQNGTFIYSPEANFNGSDSFTYQICDTNNACHAATVTITVDPVNDPPVANDDNFSLDEDTSATFDVTANDTDVDDNLDPTSANTDCDTCFGPSNGTLANNGDGTFTYRPNLNYSGPDSFVYQVCDTGPPVYCDSATVSITVVPVDDVPDAQDDAYTMNKGETLDTADRGLPGVLVNDVGEEGDPFTITAVNGDSGAVGNTITLPSDAQLTLKPDGSFTFKPRSNFRGEDLFTYTISDGNSSDTATVLITVLMPNE